MPDDGDAVEGRWRRCQQAAIIPTRVILGLDPRTHASAFKSCDCERKFPQPRRSSTPLRTLLVRINVATLIHVEISCDPAKRARTLRERGLDFYDAAQAFAGRTLTLADDRRDYGEARFQTYGILDDRIVMIVWTPRGEMRHVISMRHCHDREARRVRSRLERPR
ncbi:MULTISPECIES: BrnT family toxin [Aurantimonas]|uniref:BrnT family toxin n=1 Tax=Aurantimonas TaxID=182269 RepID=UPI00146DC00B|nr:BrnT family toxin [Aurantimonas coralicida]